MSVKDSLIGFCIRVYRKSPLCPRYGSFFAGLLNKAHSGGSRAVVKQLDDFLIKLDLSHAVDSQVYYTGVFEPDTVALLKRTLKQGGTALDVGANIGYLSLIMHTCVGEAGRVVSFEPVPTTHRRLVENINLNGFENITPVCAGLDDKVATTELSLDPATRLDGKAGAPEPVELITLDGYLERHPLNRVDLIKIDTDGAEARVIRGALQTLDRFKPTVVIELGPAELESAAESIMQLKGLGYRFFEEKLGQPIDDPHRFIEHLPAGTTANLLARHGDAS